MFRFKHPLYVGLACAALTCIGIGFSIAADETVPPAASPSFVPNPAGRTILEPDAATGGMNLVLVLPNGERRILKSFAKGESPAIPMLPAMAKLRRLGEQPRYLIGVGLKPIPEGLHARLGIEPGMGMLVTDVMPDKPAAQAGIQVHDLLLKINGMPVDEPAEVVHIVNESKLAPLKLTILRDAEPFDVTLTPIAAADLNEAADHSFGAVPALPSGVQMFGPGVIVPSSPRADLEPLQADISALRKEIKQLTEHVQHLEELLKSK